jgi:hypothetical protein
VNAPAGVLVAYATGPGMTAADAAADGKGNNGLYTSELLRAMSLQGLKVEDVFKQARARVQEKSGGRQVPWESSSLVGEFYFFGPVTVVAPTPMPGGGGVSESADLAFWNAIKDSADPGDFDAYLKQFPKGTFAALAQKRLNLLQGAKAKLSEDTAPPAKSATASRGENSLEKAEALFYAGDFKEAADWYRQAAEQGDARAQSNLGGMYRNGWGVAKDEREAVKWLRKARERRNAQAPMNRELVEWSRKMARAIASKFL